MYTMILIGLGDKPIFNHKSLNHVAEAVVVNEFKTLLRAYEDYTTISDEDVKRALDELNIPRHYVDLITYIMSKASLIREEAQAIDKVFLIDEDKSFGDLPHVIDLKEFDLEECLEKLLETTEIKYD